MFYKSMQKRKNRNFSLLMWNLLISGTLWSCLVCFVIGQDYYVSTQIFKLSMGQFLENYFFYLNNINYLVFISLLHFFFIVIIISIPRLSSYIATYLEEYLYFRALKIFFYSFLWFVILIIFLYLLELDINVEFIKFLKVNFYFIVLILIILLSVINGFLIYYESTCRSTKEKVLFYVNLIGFMWLIFRDINITVFILSFYLISHIYYPEDTKQKNPIEKSNRFIFFFLTISLFYFIISISYANYSSWLSEKLSKKSLTVGILNKELLVENKQKIVIDKSEINSLKHEIIPISTSSQNVFYLPISKGMRWYFKDSGSSSKNEHIIQVYGVQTMTSTTNPMISIETLTFNTQFRVTYP